MNGFAAVIGHGGPIALLEREMKRPAGAYLFVGASGVGKATVGRAFAAGLVCPERLDHDEPCRSCRRAESGNHPDIVVVEPEGRQSLGVEQARQTITQAVMTPVESVRKVFLFPEAEAMTDQAANSLLKTLEEPTATTVFILVVESEDDLPPTVASRCRTVHFGRVPEEVLREGLVLRSGVDSLTAADLARVAGGRPGLALGLLERPEIGRYRRAWLEVPGRVTDRTGDSFVLAAEMLDLTDEVAPEPSEDVPKEQADRDRRRSRQALLASGLEILASWYADAATLQFGGPVRNTDLDVTDLTMVSAARAIRNADHALDAVLDLQANLRPQLVLANLFTTLAFD
ncbi:MAG TPA: DNA polymerase III subunit [Acidimicrobiia bacterium]|nr:DNA polymerase III subunit [Acidimicrobiia bacterium]